MPDAPAMSNHHAAPKPWLSAKRLRAHATIVALCLWLWCAWTIATPGLLDRNGNLKGTDFLHLYTLGLVADAHHGAALYDMTAQAESVWQKVPASAGLRYLPLYPPQVSLLFAPLARLPYPWALALWWLCSAFLYSMCCYTVWRACPNLRRHGSIVVIAALGYPAFFNLIAWGQTSALALACFTLMFFSFRARRSFLAGIALGCLIFKPQLALAAAAVFVATGAWRVIAGAALSAAVETGSGLLYYGVAPFRQWISTMTHVRTLLPLLEPRLYQTHSLRTFWSMLIPWPGVSFAVYIASAAVVLGLAILTWRRAFLPIALRYSVLLLATVLVAPHLTVYDLVILAPALLLLADYLVGTDVTATNRHLGALLYFIYILPLIGPFARFTHVQLSVVAISAALLLISQMSAEDFGPHPTQA